jgi:hypothetical protein
MIRMTLLRAVYEAIRLEPVVWINNRLELQCTTEIRYLLKKKEKQEGPNLRWKNDF